MRPEVVKFYEDAKRPVVLIIENGIKEFGLTRGQIEKAMEIVYDDPTPVKPIRLVWKVWDVAKGIRGEEFVIDVDAVRNVMNDNLRLTDLLNDTELYAHKLVLKWLSVPGILSLGYLGWYLWNL